MLTEEDFNEMLTPDTDYQSRLAKSIQGEDEDIEGSSFMETVKAHTLIDNSLVAPFFQQSGMPDSVVSDVNFNPLDYLTEDEMVDERFVSSVLSADSESEINAVRRQSEWENEQRAVVANGGFLAIMAAEMLDPVNLIPVAGTTYKTYKTGSSILRGAAVTGGSIMGATAAEEALLQHSQVTRTMGESAVNIGAAGLIGAVFGATPAAMKAFTAKHSLDYDKILKDVGDALDPEFKVSNGMNPSLSMGAAKVRDLGDVQIKGVTARGFVKAMRWMSPLTRTATSNAKSTRLISARLAENPLDMERPLSSPPAMVAPGDVKSLGDETLEQAAERVNQTNLKAYKTELDNYESTVSYESAETRIKQKEAYLYRSLMEHDKLLKGYFETQKGQAGYGGVVGFLKSGLNRRAFNEEVAKAVRSGRSDNEFIQKAADNWRSNFYNPLLKEAQELGLIADGVDTKTAVNYLNRIWDKEKIIERSPEFKKTVKSWLISKHADKLGADKDRVLGLVENAGNVNELEDILSEIKPETVGAIESRLIRKKGQDDYLQIENIDIDKSMRGAGYGVSIYEDFIEEAVRKGYKKVVSDSSVSDDAKRVYDSLKKRGYKVKALADDAESFEREFSGGTQNVSKGGTPLFEIDLTSIPKRKKAAYAKGVKPSIKKREDGRGIDVVLSRGGAGEWTREILNADSIADEIVTKITASTDGRLPYDYQIGENSFGLTTIEGGSGSGGGLKGAFKSRSFMIPDELVEDFLVNDIEELSHTYLRSVASDIEITKEFGDVGATRAIQDINNEYRELIDAAPSNKRKGIERKQAQDIADVKGMIDRMRGTYVTPASSPFGQITTRFFNAAKDINYLRLMGGVLPSSIPDVARIIMAEGYVNTLKDGLFPMIKNINSYKVAVADAAPYMKGMTALGSRADVIADTAYMTQGGTKFERGLRAMAKQYSNINLMNQWTSFTKGLHGVVTQTRIADELVVGTFDKRLPQLGMSMSELPDIAKQIKKHGYKKDGVWVINTTKWDRPDLAQKWMNGMRKESDRVIIMPGQEKPLFMSTPIGSTLLQFKSFMMASTLRVTASALQGQDKHLTEGMISLIGLGMMSYAFKEWDAGRELSDDPTFWVMEGIDRSGALGILGEMDNTLTKLSKDSWGLRPMLGINKHATRFASRSVMESALGPSFGLAGDTLKVGSELIASEDRGGRSFDDSDVRAIRRLMPYQNLMILRQFFDKIEDSIGE